MRQLVLFLTLCSTANLFAAGLTGKLPPVNGIIQAFAVDGDVAYAAVRDNSSDPYTRIQRYADGAWTSLSATITGSVYTMTVGQGNLYIGGSFHLDDHAVTMENLAMWSSYNWSALGEGIDGSVYALAMEGERLYVGGAFTNAGGLGLTADPCGGPVIAKTDGIAVWDRGNWQALGQGVDGIVTAIAIEGTTVYAGGKFSRADGAPANGIAAWDGQQWQPMGDGLTGTVYSIAVNGTAVYAGGQLTASGEVVLANIAAWDGLSWSPLSQGIDGIVGALSYYQGTLLVGGHFQATQTQSFDYLAKWDGKSWDRAANAPAGPLTGLVRVSGGCYASSEDSSDSLIFVAD